MAASTSRGVAGSLPHTSPLPTTKVTPQSYTASCRLISSIARPSFSPMIGLAKNSVLAGSSVGSGRSFPEQIKMIVGGNRVRT